MLQLDNEDNQDFNYNPEHKFSKIKEKKIKFKKEKPSKYISGSQFNVSAAFRQKDKKPLIFKLAVFVLAFLVIAAIITAIRVANYKSYLLEEEVRIKYSAPTEEPANVHFGIDSVEDMYNENSIKISYEEESEGDKVELSPTDFYYKVSYKYPQIDGLRSNRVQENINDIIRDTALDMYTEENKKDLSIKNIEIKADVVANYSNVLSIKFVKKTTMTNNKEIDQKNAFKARNFNLQTGEEISFSDVFTNDTDIKKLLYEKSYDYLSLSNYGIKDSNIDVSKLKYIKIIENDVYRIMNAYKNKKNFEFCFDKENVEIFIANQYIK